MTFQPHQSKNIVDDLHNLDKYFIRIQSNILRRLTLGLKRLYADMQSLPKSTNKISYHNIILSKDSPLLDNRYQIINLIGTGNFSNVYSVCDLYTRRNKAIKVLHKGYHTMGVRENLILNHIYKYQAHSSMPCCKLRFIYKIFHTIILILFFLSYSSACI